MILSGFPESRPSSHAFFHPAARRTDHGPVLMVAFTVLHRIELFVKNHRSCPVDDQMAHIVRMGNLVVPDGVALQRCVHFPNSMRTLELSSVRPEIQKNVPLKNTIEF